MSFEITNEKKILSRREALKRCAALVVVGAAATIVSRPSIADCYKSYNSDSYYGNGSYGSYC